MNLEQLEALIVDQLAQSFTPRKDRPLVTDLSSHAEFNEENVPLQDGLVISSDAGTAVTWQYHGVDRKGLYGMAPTRRKVVVRGATIVVGDNLERVVHYVDWLDVYRQLGQSFAGRSVRAGG